MKIHVGYDLIYECVQPTPIIFMLNVHPSRAADLLTADRMRITPARSINSYVDAFGNKCVRLLAPAGEIRIAGDAIVADSGLPACLDSDLPTEPDWPDAVQRAAYRSVQEGLTNARKHAPGAPITIQLRAQGRTLLVRVRNDPPPAPAGQPGHGFPHGGHGLIGLRERAELLGGQLRAGPTDAGGFDLLVTLGVPAG